MKIFIGADHRGFDLKEKVKNLLSEKYDVDDLGNHVHDPDDDYTTYASRVAGSVSENENSLGIVMCGSGVGVDVTANKFDGARAAIGKNAQQVKAGRHDDNFNILVIASDYTEEDEAKEMIKAFLETKYTPTERYERRLQDIEKIENIN